MNYKYKVFSFSLILFVWPVFGDIILCPKKEYIISLNMTQTYYRTKFSKLPGVDKDRDSMHRISEKLSGKSVDFNDDDLIGRDKHFVLSRMRELSKDFTSVFFNYSGHGLVNSKGVFAIPLVSAPEKCFKKGHLKKSKSIDSFYKGMMTQSYYLQKKGIAIEAKPSESLEKNNSKNQKPATESIALNTASEKIPVLVQIFNDQDKDCLNYVITAEDIKKTFNDKSIFGFIDSCYSGALKNTTGINMIYSASDTQTSADLKSGGVLFGLVDKIMSEYACVEDHNRNGQLSLKEISNKLPVVAIADDSGTSVELMSIDDAKKKLEETLKSQLSELTSFNKVKDHSYVTDLSNAPDIPGQTLNSNFNKSGLYEAQCFDLVSYDSKNCDSIQYARYFLKEPMKFNCSGKNGSTLIEYSVGRELNIYQRPTKDNQSFYGSPRGCTPKEISQSSIEIQKNALNPVIQGLDKIPTTK